MIYRNIFAERLILLRKERNLYQKDIADVLGVTKNAITKLEKAQRSPSFEVLVALADYFNVTLDYLNQLKLSGNSRYINSKKTLLFWLL